MHPMDTPKRRFIDALADERCTWTVVLRDGSEARCGRRKTSGPYCTQHTKIDKKDPTMAARVADRIDGYDRDDLGESPDY